MKTHLLDENALLSCVQILLQWLLKKVHCPQLKLIVQMFSFLHCYTVKLLKFHVTWTSVAAYSMWILYVLLIEWVSVYLSLSFFFFFLPFPFLIRSGTVHILHNHMPPALSQWWYSQHFALYYDLHFSHISPFPPQRHHWVPEHLFPSHGYMWVWPIIR